MIRFLFVMVLLGLSTAVQAECRTELKPTDRYSDLSNILKCLKDEIGKLRTVPSESAPPINETPPVAVNTEGEFNRIFGPYSIKLTACNQKNKTVVCKIEFTSVEDGLLMFNVGGTIYADKSGLIHSCNKIQAQKSNGYSTPLNKTGDSTLVISTQAGIPYTADVIFKQSALDIQLISRLSLSLHSKEWQNLEFMNVPISN